MSRASDCRFRSAFSSCHMDIFGLPTPRHSAIAAVKPFFPREDALNVELGKRRDRAANISGSLDLRAAGVPAAIIATVLPIAILLRPPALQPAPPGS